MTQSAAESTFEQVKLSNYRDKRTALWVSETNISVLVFAVVKQTFAKIDSVENVDLVRSH